MRIQDILMTDKRLQENHMTGKMIQESLLTDKEVEDMRRKRNQDIMKERLRVMKEDKVMIVTGMKDRLGETQMRENTQGQVGLTPYQAETQAEEITVGVHHLEEVTPAQVEEEILTLLKALPKLVTKDRLPLAVERR